MHLKPILLSIVIPCYGRHDLLEACLGSIERGSDRAIQVVLVDDGSSPPLESVFSRFRQAQDILIVQTNRGRAAALREGILAAVGEFVLLMDSDDEFIPGSLPVIVQELYDLPVDGIVFECDDFDTGRPIARVPDGIVTNLLALRADLKVRGDLKEVVRLESVRRALYSDPGSERRVPTSYIWAGFAADGGQVLLRSRPVVKHRYLRGGMTHSIAMLKRKNPRFLSQTYYRIAAAPKCVYRSSVYRVARAAMALSISEGLSVQQKVELRRSLGWVNYGVALLAAFLVKVRSSLVSAVSGQLRSFT